MAYNPRPIWHSPQDTNNHPRRLSLASFFVGSPVIGPLQGGSIQTNYTRPSSSLCIEDAHFQTQKTTLSHVNTRSSHMKCLQYEETRVTSCKFVDNFFGVFECSRTKLVVKTVFQSAVGDKSGGLKSRKCIKRDPPAQNNATQRHQCTSYVPRIIK